jgi:hypothetical protein
VTPVVLLVITEPAANAGNVPTKFIIIEEPDATDDTVALLNRALVMVAFKPATAPKVSPELLYDPENPVPPNNKVGSGVTLVPDPATK